MRKNLEQGTLARPVAPNNSQRLTLLHSKANVLQCPNRLALAVAMINLPDLLIWIGFAALPCPPALEVAAKGAGADHAELVTLGKIFNGDSGIRHVRPYP